MKEVTLTPQSSFSAPTRLDAYLAQSFSDYSRSYFRRLIDEGHIKINGKGASKASYLVRDDDSINVAFPPEDCCSVEPQKVDFEVVDSNKDFVIVNKPAGLLVHHSCKSKKEETLVAGLLYHFNDLKGFEDPIRPGIVHRLDRDTSGLLIVARNTPAHIKLSDMFQKRNVKKTYLALVHGHPPQEGKIDFPIGRSIREPHKMSHTNVHGRSALSYYKVLAYYEDYSLVQVRIVTGRTHQIRVHLSAIGHSIVGDELYGKKSKLISRQALHAWKVEFSFNENEYSYCSPLPEDIRKIFSRIKKASW